MVCFEAVQKSNSLPLSFLDKQKGVTTEGKTEGGGGREDRRQL